MVIYLVENVINGKKYVGQTIHSLNRRWSWHCHYSSGCVALHNAIEKYGKENFTIKVIDTATTRDELDEKEIYWINELSTIAPNGYNLKSGGKHCEYSDASIKKMKKSHKGLLAGAKSPNYGKHLTEETKRKIGESSKGRLHTQEYKEMMKLRMTGANNARSKKVLCIETGEIFDSCGMASRKVNCCVSCINACCRGIQKTAKGYHWTYLDRGVIG